MIEPATLTDMEVQEMSFPTRRLTGRGISNRTGHYISPPRQMAGSMTGFIRRKTVTKNWTPTDTVSGMMITAFRAAG